MTYKNYLIRMTPSSPNEFILGRGYNLDEEIDGLALVRAQDLRDSCSFTGGYAIIDIPTGLFVCKAKSKKKLLERWNQFKEDRDIMNLIIKAREKEIYLTRVAEASLEKDLWRKSGYKIEGR